MLGAAQHDIGWALVDLEPRLNEDTGLPRGFLETTVEEHLAIWRGAPEQAGQPEPRRGAGGLDARLLAVAAEGLRCRAAQEARMLQEHVAEEQARQALLRERLGVSEAHAERTRRQMWTWDSLSLALCLGWQPVHRQRRARTGGPARRRAARAGRRALGGGPLAVRRATRVRVHCEGRRLAGGFGDRAGAAGGLRRRRARCGSSTCWRRPEPLAGEAPEQRPLRPALARARDHARLPPARTCGRSRPKGGGRSSRGWWRRSRRGDPGGGSSGSRAAR